ncbi:MAG: MFS transporter [Planctomycetes bacterium]|nr:MFS transporter [Planctomycetota bacterium]
MRRDRSSRRDLRAIWIDGMAWSVMVGMGEQLLPACALAAGFTSVAAGLTATLPMLGGAVLQLLLAPFVARARSLKAWVLTAALLQGVVFLPLAVGAARGALGAWFFFACATLYWTLAITGNPAWSTWVEQHVPKRLETRYWSRRQGWIHVFTMLGLLAGGTLLERAGAPGAPLRAFAWVFVGAACARFVSVAFLARQSELEPHPEAARRVSPAEFLARFRRGHDGRLFVALLASQAALQFALPYFLPYVLGPLGFDYPGAMALLAAAVLGRFLTLPAFGELARKRSLSTLFLVGGALCVPATLGWLASERFVALLAAQLFAGAAFGAFELATFLAFFARIDRDERTSLLTWYHLANALAFAAGSLAGGWLLQRGGSTASAFQTVFAVAAGLRLGAFLLLLRAERGARAR